ncbi:MAG: DUF2796 domain-containing protein [Nitrosospira sp.]|nr:DUF2796 domain-containing protein [Nitrosospira sp.]
MKQALHFSGWAMIGIMMTFALSASAHAPGAHVHGLAKLEIAIDDATVEINLVSPLDNLVGFEHMPRNEKERQAIKTMASKLQQPQNLFIFAPAAQCSLRSTKLESSVLSPELLTPAAGVEEKDGKNAGRDATKSSMHGELEATWYFNCAFPQALRGLDVKLFQTFPILQRIDTAVAGPAGQSSAKLTPASTRLKW